MPLPTLPSKLVWERVKVDFNFSSELLFNEAITSWEVTVAVQTGEDSSPDDMLATRRFLLGPVASQWIIQGLPGVVYRLTGTAVGSTGKTYKLEKTLAVLPCEQVIPPLFGVVYTTPLYPVDLTESLDSIGNIPAGYSLAEYVDFLDIVGVITDGALRTPLIEYIMEPEALDSIGSILSGDLRTPLITYAMQPEALDTVGVLINGVLDQILITYTNWPAESLDMAGSITAGTLS
jgi:hypothetical protein